jgi:plastocyanin
MPMPGSRRTTGVSLVPVAAVATLVLIAAGCGRDAQPRAGGGGQETESEETEGGGTITVAGEEANDHGTEDVTGMTSVEMEMDDFYFEPTVLSGEAGQTLTVELHNEGSLRHTFTVDSLEVDVNLGGDETGEAEITFPDSGALLFYCQFHDGSGMRGGLSVGGALAAAATEDGSGGGGGGGGGDDGGSEGPGYGR